MVEGGALAQRLQGALRDDAKDAEGRLRLMLRPALTATALVSACGAGQATRCGAHSVTATLCARWGRPS